MEFLRYFVTPDGTLGEPWAPPAPAEKTASALPGSALADLLAEDDDEDWGGDAPDVSAEFARLGHLAEEAEEEKAPLTAEFALRPDGTLTLTRWPRLARPAFVPDEVEGHPVMAIGATAFAASHIAEERFTEFYRSPISFSVFCMRMGRYTDIEPVDEGGPTELRLPAGLRQIGPYAFWHCTNLTAVTLPEGIEELSAGAFGDCCRLAEVTLPRSLKTIGYLPRPTDQVMPDVGVFAGCHALRSLTIPAGVTAIGAQTFNSAGLVTLTALDGPKPAWSREITVAATAFDHAAALLWLNKADPAGKILYQLGLPVARDKILAGDRKFGRILRVPVDFFTQPAGVFDALAREAFRLDFSARMALSRLNYDAALSDADRQWDVSLLVQYFDRAPQFMPAKPEAAYAELFRQLCQSELLTAADVSEMLRQAGALGLPAELISEMMAVRTQRFESVTGFEDLDLD